MGYLHNQGKTDDLNPRLLEAPGLSYRLQASCWKGPLPWVFVTMAVMERAQVSSYCSTVSSHCILPSRSWVGENVPTKRVALAARDRYHAGKEKGRGLPAKLGPGEQLFSQSCSPQGEAHTSFLHSSCEGGSF